MRVRVVVPIYTEDPNKAREFLEELTPEVGWALDSGTQLSLRCLRAGPASIECFVDEVMATPYILEEVVKAEGEGEQAVVINCFGDPALWASREAVRIPVVGAGQAAMVLAGILGESFSIVTVLDKVVPMIKRNARLYGLSNRLASIRWVNVPVLQIEQDRDSAVQRVIREAEVAVEQDGAEVVVLGCTGFSRLAAEVRKELPVPVVDPTLAAIKMAEVLVSRGWSHSKSAFPFPPPKRRYGFPGLSPAGDERAEAIQQLTVREEE